MSVGCETGRDVVRATVRMDVQTSTYLNLYFDPGFLFGCFGFLLVWLCAFRLDGLIDY